MNTLMICIIYIYVKLHKFIMSLVKYEVQNKLAQFVSDKKLQKTNYLDDPVYLLSDHTGAANEVHFSPNGSILASCAEEIILWSITNEVKSVGALRPHKKGITSLSWHIDSTKIASVSADTTICIQDIPSGSIIRRIKTHKEIINTCQFMTEDPNLLVTGDDRNMVYIHDIRTKEEVASRKSNSPVVSVAIKGPYIAVGGIDGDLYINSLNKDPAGIILQRRLKGDTPIFGTSFRKDGLCCAVVTSDGYLRIYDNKYSVPDERRILANERFAEDQLEIIPTRCVWSDNNLIAAGSTDGILRIWDAENEIKPVLKYSLPGHKGSVTGVDIHPNYPIVASCDTAGNVIIGELAA